MFVRAIVFKFAKQIVDLEPELAAELDVIPSTKTMVARRTSQEARGRLAEAQRGDDVNERLASELDKLSEERAA